MRLLLLLLFTCTASMAQEFNVSLSGLVSKKDPAKNYVVASFSGVSADSLYAKVSAYMETKYSGAAVVAETEENKSINYSIQDAAVSTIKKNGAEVTYYTSYNMLLDFKDGKIRIAFSNVKIYTVNESKEKKDYAYNSFWNTEGKVVDPNTKRIVEDYYNASVKAMIRDLKGDNDRSADW